MTRPLSFLVLSFLFVFTACGKKNNPSPTSGYYQGVVSTVAGTGDYGYQDGPANTATFWTPTGIVGDGLGNLYVADYENALIRKIDKSGNVTTLAGQRFLVGLNDGIGTQATFRHPYGITIDNIGNLYVADSEDNAIRKITQTGVVTTIAGSRFPGFTDGPGGDARFKFPTGIAVDKNGVLFVVDQGNSAIRKISPTGTVTTIAGGTYGDADGQGSSAKFAYPVGIAIDSYGNLYVADSGNSKIKKITSDGTVTTFAGTSGAGNITFDSSDNIYISMSNSVVKIPKGGTAIIVAGNGQRGYTDGAGPTVRFYGTNGLYVDDEGNIYVADTGNNMIRKIVQH